MVPPHARGGIHRSDLLSFYRADLVMEALDHDNNTHYVAMEACYTADARDTDRVSRNAGFLTRFTGQPAHGVIASRQNDRAVQRRVKNKTVHWFQLTEGDLQPNWWLTTATVYVADRDPRERHQAELVP